MGGVTTAFSFARNAALSTFGTAEVQDQWNTWRQEAREQAGGKGPVKRSIPKSAEPPALVLMRDYFTVSLTAALVLSSSVYVSFAWFLRGAMRGTMGLANRPANDAKQPPKRDAS
ncbi:MAG: hypothetical protein RIS70_3946 [Planctomycetota bacterium]